MTFGLWDKGFRVEINSSPTRLLKHFWTLLRTGSEYFGSTSLYITAILHYWSDLTPIMIELGKYFFLQRPHIFSILLFRLIPQPYCLITIFWLGLLKVPSVCLIFSNHQKALYWISYFFEKLFFWLIFHHYSN